jgi:hypothetical protein
MRPASESDPWGLTAVAPVPLGLCRCSSHRVLLAKAGPWYYVPRRRDGPSGRLLLAYFPTQPGCAAGEHAQTPRRRLPGPRGGLRAASRRWHSGSLRLPVNTAGTVTLRGPPAKALNRGAWSC